jgi:hypothetical protein
VLNFFSGRGTVSFSNKDLLHAAVWFFTLRHVMTQDTSEVLLNERDTQEVGDGGA